MLPRVSAVSQILFIIFSIGPALLAAMLTRPVCTYCIASPRLHGHDTINKPATDNMPKKNKKDRVTGFFEAADGYSKLSVTKGRSSYRTYFAEPSAEFADRFELFADSNYNQVPDLEDRYVGTGYISFSSETPAEFGRFVYSRSTSEFSSYVGATLSGVANLNPAAWSIV